MIVIVIVIVAVDAAFGERARGRDSSR